MLVKTPFEVRRHKGEPVRLCAFIPIPPVNFLLTDFQPFFQHQYDRSSKAVGAEILMRPCFGDVQKAIAQLTAANQIYLLDVLAFQYAVLFSKQYSIECASNFSGNTLARKTVKDEIQNYGLSDVRIEITESDNLNSRAVENIKQLNRSGFEISLDDYGSDRNGLNRIMLPISELKIDRYIVNQLPNKKAQIAIASTITMAHQLGCTVVAEGVETKQQFELLHLFGCDRFQGYFFHKPTAYYRSMCGGGAH